MFYKCPSINTSDIGVIYLSYPYSENSIVNSRWKQSTYKLQNYYSLLLLSKYFKASSEDRILFYYINSINKPVSNFYNQWLNDSFWSQKIPLESIKFQQLKYKSVENNDDVESINLYKVLQKIIHISQYHFDKPKKYVLFSTSDVVIGPNILSCFSLDLSTHVSERSKISFECFNKIHSEPDAHEFTYYSFLYSINIIHKINQFAGVFIWKVVNKDNKRVGDNHLIEDDDDKTIKIDDIKTKRVSDAYNVHKLSYKDEVFIRNRINFVETFGIFGYEVNKYEPPQLESAFDPSTNNNYFYRTIRRFLYNRYESFKYEITKEAKIPNVVHLIWFGEQHKVMKFIEYLCLKSIITVVKPDKIKIHGDEPIGDWWDKIKTHPKIELVKLERPMYKYGQDFTNSPIQHLADVARLEVLYEEGGLYTDFDVLWVKPIDEFRYIDVELIASNDLTSYCYEFPNNIQIGVFLAQPKSSFIREWLERYNYYHLFPGDYTAISMCEPYRIYEKNPQRVLINNRLQMIFFNGWSMFIPRFVEFSKVHEFNLNMDWLNNGSYAYHLPRYAPLFTENDYKNANISDIPIQIAKYILDLPLD